MKRHRSCGILFVSALLSISATAVAEKPTPAAAQLDDHYMYQFTDDALLGGSNGVLGERVRVPPMGYRVALIRPRSSFVPELLKSVEKL